jgi:hypothetical protein
MKYPAWSNIARHAASLLSGSESERDRQIGGSSAAISSGETSPARNRALTRGTGSPRLSRSLSTTRLATRLPGAARSNCSCGQRARTPGSRRCSSEPSEQRCSSATPRAAAAGAGRSGSAAGVAVWFRVTFKHWRGTGRAAVVARASRSGTAPVRKQSGGRGVRAGVARPQ